MKPPRQNLDKPRDPLVAENSAAELWRTIVGKLARKHFENLRREEESAKEMPEGVVFLPPEGD